MRALHFTEKYQPLFKFPHRQLMLFEKQQLLKSMGRIIVVSRNKELPSKLTYEEEPKYWFHDILTTHGQPYDKGSSVFETFQ
jgi:hypothetical protein